MKRSFLFLQGPRSPFFALLSRELAAKGHRVLKVNFNSADRFFWSGENTADYKHPLSEFSAYVKNVSRLRKITDLVIYNDDTPVNKLAVEALKNLKIRLHVFADGIFGDNWVTLENRIFGEKTVFPKDPRFYLRNMEPTSPRPKKFNNRRAKSLHQLRYELALKSGRIEKWDDQITSANIRIKNSINKYLVARKSKKQSSQLRDYNYFLADYDLRKKSSFVRSFAKYSHEDNILVFIRNSDISHYQLSKMQEVAEKYKVGDRVVMLGRADFSALVKNAQAYITNNSPDALIALRYGVPVMALASAMYNMEGLASQRELTDFWQIHEQPNSEIFRKFRNYVIDKTQVNGSFYTNKGMKLALRQSVGRILGEEVYRENSEVIA